MPFLIKFKKDVEKPYYYLYNLTKKTDGKGKYKTLQSAVNIAKNAIKFREKKESKVVKRGSKIYVLPFDYSKVGI